MIVFRAIVLALLLCLQAASALADPSPFIVIGRDLIKLKNPMPTSVRPGQIEIIYFFWYGSPAAAEIDRDLRAWAATRPYAVRFTPAPAAFDPVHGQFAARVFFALDRLGREKTVSPLFLEAVTARHVDPSSPADVLAWMEINGIPPKNLQSAINDPRVKAKSANVRAVMRAYQIQNTPSVVINGRYLIPSRPGQTAKQWLAVVQFAADNIARTGKGP